MTAGLKRLIGVARGVAPADLVLKNARVVNVLSGEILEADVAVCDGLIAGVGRYDGPVVKDLEGLYLAPGFIDGHFHIESSLLTPPQLARAVSPHGTTAVVADPHELANVLGREGIRYLIAATEGLGVDFFFMLPSCVPATDLETAGAAMTAADLSSFAGEERVLGLGEMMNFPGVVYAVEAVLEKIMAFSRRPRDGHAPLLSGRDLNAYIAAGIGSDHECTRLEEAREKLRLGMHIFIREGTQAKNLDELLPLVTPATLSRCSFVTDDLHPHEILRNGHLDALLRRAIGAGLDPVSAIAMVTVNTARHFGLTDRGAVAPGCRADLVVLSALDPLRVVAVYKGGREVAREGEALFRPDPAPPPPGMSVMNVGPYGVGAFAVPARPGRVRVMELVPGQILTKAVFLEPRLRDGLVVPDTGRDVLKIAVIERHRGTGNIAVGFVRGFGLRRGALASSVAHDSHNIVCVGADDESMLTAAKEVEAMKGGLVVALPGHVTARLPLPVGGLMSDLPLEEVAAGWEELRGAAAGLGCPLDEPFMCLSFLALPVVPELKITDRGLVDVGKFAFVSLFEEGGGGRDGPEGLKDKKVWGSFHEREGTKPEGLYPHRSLIRGDHPRRPGRRRFYRHALLSDQGLRHHGPPGSRVFRQGRGDLPGGEGEIPRYGGGLHGRRGRGEGDPQEGGPPLRPLCRGEDHHRLGGRRLACRASTLPGGGDAPFGEQGFCLRFLDGRDDEEGEGIMSQGHKRSLLNYLIDRDLQVRVIVYGLIYMVAVVTVVVVIMLIPVVREMDWSQSAEVRRHAALLFIFTAKRVVPAAGVIIVLYLLHLVVITHRICGPLINFSHTFRRVGEGDFTRTVHLRQGDYLRKESERINAMVNDLSRMISAVKDLHGRIERDAAALAGRGGMGEESAADLARLRGEIEELGRVLSRFRTSQEGPENQ